MYRANKETQDKLAKIGCGAGGNIGLALHSAYRNAEYIPQNSGQARALIVTAIDEWIKLMEAT